MATSTFYEKIIIDDKAADVIINGLSSPKPPRPKYNNELERGQEILKQFLSNSTTLSINQQK